MTDPRAETVEQRLASFTDDLARAIGPVLKRLYPQNPDVVLGREARVIAAAINPVVQGIHDPLGRDHMEEMAEHAARADMLAALLDEVLNAGTKHLSNDLLHRAMTALFGREERSDD